MHTLLRTLPLLALLAAPLQALGGTTATMQVSFTVLASCTVDEHGAAQPAVNCGQSVGYIVAPRMPAAVVAAPAGIVAGNRVAGWTVYF